MSQERCPHCIQSFSPEILALYRQIKETGNQEERGELIIRLAQMYEAEYDSTDAGFTESFHRVMDDYHQAFLQMNQAGLRLGRVVLHLLEEHVVSGVDTTLPVPVRSDSVPN